MTAAANTAETWVRQHELPQLGLAVRSVKRAVAEGRFVSRREGRERLVKLSSLPREVQERYLERERAGADEWVRRLGRFPAETREAIRIEAARRGRLLDRFEAVPQRWVRVDGRDVPSAAVCEILADWPARDPAVLAAFPSWARVPSERTLRNALAEFRAGGSLRLVRAAPAPEAGEGATLPEALRREIEVMRFDTHPHATFIQLYRHLVKRFGRELGEAMPCERTVRRYIQRTFTAAQDVYERQGPKTFRNTQQEPILRDLSSIGCGEVLVGDHREFDLEVINPARGGELERPWITCWFDLGSRCPAGWVISFSPDSRAIAEAFAVAVGPKTEPLLANVCGLPNVVHQDNGKDYRASALLHLYAETGVEVRQALPFNPKSKLVERFFATMSMQFDRDFPQYLGSTPERRSERTREMRDEHRRWLRREVPSTPFITLDEFKRRFAAWVQEYVQQPHEELKERETGRVCSPAQRAAERQLPIRLPDPRSLAMLAWPRFERVVRKGMVGVDKHFYAAPELLALEGKRVELARDPANILAGVVYGQGKIFNVAAKARLPFIRPGVTDAISLDQVKEANRRQRDEEKLLRDARKAREARREREAAGSSHLAEVVAEKPVTPSPSAPAAPAPKGSVRQMHPIDRAARARKAERPPSKAEQWARAVEGIQAATAPASAPSVAAVDEVLADHIRAEGSRPEQPEFVTDLELQRLRRDQAEWDEALARRRAARADLTTSRGG